MIVNEVKKTAILAPLEVDDRRLMAAMLRAGFYLTLSMEGFPRIRCRLPSTWNTGTQRLDHHLLYVVFSGSIVVSTTGGESLSGPSDALLIPPGLSFRAHCAAGAVRLARLRFRIGRPGHALVWGHKPRRWNGLAGIEPVLSIAEDLLLRGGQEPAEHLAVFTLLFGALQRAGGDQALTPAQVSELRQRIVRDPHCTPTDLARVLGLSHDYATRLISRSLGQPPRGFILQERLRLAADRLAAGGAAADVALGLGWQDHKLFLRQFRTAYGMPPGRWLRHLA